MRRHRRSLLLVLFALGLVLGGAYVGRRRPVGPQQGVGISWPVDAHPVVRTHFRIATYNIRRGKGTDHIRDLSRAARLLDQVDLAGLNEVGGPALGGRADQAERLGRSLRVGWLFAPNQARWCQYHLGNGLLSRLDVGGWASAPLVYDRARSHNCRSLLTAQVTTGAQPLTFLVTHLDPRAIRPIQLQGVLEEFVKQTPAVLVGDFNTTAADPTLQAFFADSNNVDAIGRALGPSDSPQRVDWIITRGLKVLAGGMEPVGVSDHPCYWVDVEPLTVAGPEFPAERSNL